jgi:hypothetical protein
MLRHVSPRLLLKSRGLIVAKTPNSALLTDAYFSALRASLGAAKRER